MIRSFSWDAISADLINHAPTLFRVLKRCVAVKSKGRSTCKPSNRPNSSICLCVCVAILLRHRNVRMNLIYIYYAKIIITFLFFIHCIYIPKIGSKAQGQAKAKTAIIL